jgi:protein-L-isoaspartate(D-aspartate) O-methyltransferase
MDFSAARRTMIATQVKTAAVTDPLVVSAFEAVAREAFVPANQRAFAYMDEDLPVGKGRCAMEPAVLARLLQLADVQPGDRALVTAAGSGYSAAVLAQMTGSVVAVDSDPAVLGLARQGCAAVGAAVTVVSNDPMAGYADRGPYDVILIDGAVMEIPAALEAQLKDGGRLVAVVRREGVGRATVVTRAGNAFSRREGFDAMTPLLPEFTLAPKFVF